eukprot:Nitzschia sp. Nitz4//scaffold75_size92586//60734//62470//NITZ4_004862-RA/size92586-processed-gene-0.46-mRNA-1//-1//CDS//3329557726//822//frame0
MGKSYDVEYFENLLQECEQVCYKKAPNVKSSHRQGFVEACEVFHAAFEEAKQASTEDELVKAAKVQEKAMKKCVKAATKIFDKLDMTENPALQAAMMRGCIIVKATPAKLAEFCAKDSKNGKLVDHLLKETGLMKDMLTFGGAKDGNYGDAMLIYTDILATFPDIEDEFTPTNKKIALAVALELATPMCEFDTKVEVDPLKRYIHYRDAFKHGELDPAFPHFSVWEMRHIINCDAPDDQLKWGRSMMMNYAPYITALTDKKMQYLYILQTDVLTRKPSWTSSPRTYQQVISGGGNDGPNAWFGRFICKAFGTPTWGCKQPSKNALTRWTPSGWVECNGAVWDECEWEGVSGIDFKGEADARAAFTPDDYYNKLVLLECLAEVMDNRRGEIPPEEKAILHPLRTWRSLSIIQKALLLESVSPEKFVREGESPVRTKCEKYLMFYERDDPDTKVKVKDGTTIIPAGLCGSNFGNVMVVTSFDGGKQVNFAGSGFVEYDLPGTLEAKTYKVSVEVNTVHLKQVETFLVPEDGEPVPITIPYTQGSWEKTKPVEVTLGPDMTLTFKREKGNLGVAIRKVFLS